jgi:nickel-dependent lactate racemase
MPVLRYGAESSVHLEFADGVVADQCGTPRGEPLADPAEAVQAALETPLEWPPLRQTATPGDHVVLALDRGVPHSAQITAAIVRSLVASGIDPDGITVLRTRADMESGTENPCRLIGNSLGARITLVTHDPADRQGLAYLAAAETGEPILMNRLLTDADLVLPVGCIQGEGVAGYFGVQTPVYPGLSDYKTLARFRGLDLLPSNGLHKKKLSAEVKHVAWLLGVTFTLQIVPAAGDGVLHVLAGQIDAVRRQARQLYREAWTSSVASRASLVVAAIEGGAGQQTWENLGRALEAAGRLVEEGGAIAVCCEIAAAPGPAVQSMVGEPSSAADLRHIRKQRPSDAIAAAQIAQAVEEHQVFLLSRLDPSLVEDLDMMPVAGPEELARLTRRHGSCILLANAQHAIVKVEEQ